ncbi:hypothetical protein CPB86DRAFT_825516 [Serendipita vermifera]|nr:hypothetical protein CPB86DRAFT_825516 [Serendipita vermifera]
MRLDHLLSQKQIKKTTRIWELQVDEERVGEEYADPQMWPWLLPDGIHLLSMSKSGILKLWDLQRVQVLATIDIGGRALSWDYAVDAKGITMSITSIPLQRFDQTFQLWRCDWANLIPRCLISKVMGQEIRLNWSESDIAGCFMQTANGDISIYAASLKTLGEVYIKTTLSLTSNFTTSISSIDLFLYDERGDKALYYSYKLDWLKEQLQRPMETIEQAPHFIRAYSINNTHLQGRWFPTCQNLWDGRIGIISLAMSLEASDADYLNMAVFEGEDVVFDGYERVKPYMAHWIKNSCLAATPDMWDLSIIRRYGKTIVWMENTDGITTPDLHEIGQLCFANFPPPKRDKEPDSKGRVLSTNVGLDRECVSNTTSTTHPTGAVEDPLVNDIPQPITSSTDINTVITPNIESSSTEGHHNIPHLDHPSTQSSASSLDDTKKNPITFGDICKFNIPQIWISRYQGIFGVDFDDAKGRLAFGTGVGKVLIVELL